MKVSLAYGRGALETEFPDSQTTVIQPRHQAGLANEHEAVIQALDRPIDAAVLGSKIRSDANICIVHTDITRATPNERLIPWLLDYLHSAGADRQRITLLNATGTHRPNSRSELEEMLTAEVVANYRCLNHAAEDLAACERIGSTRSGAPALINRHFLEADIRIVTGFIEPHFFAGFSGGPKGIMPGIAGLPSVVSNHGAANIADSNATFGITEGNPIWEEMRDIALLAGPSFLLNVTLNERRQITGVFAGDLIAAHRAGIEFVRESAMQAVRRPFDIVVTTNSGYPLDQNLYQGVKGMAAAARIVKEGGAIILAAECCDGVPDGSPHDRLLRSTRDGEQILQRLAEPGFTSPEQWQAQVQSLIQRRATIYVRSELPADVIRAAHLLPCADVAAAATRELTERGPRATLAVLPQGPLTIPYLSN